MDYHKTQVRDILEFGWPVDYIADCPPISSMTNHHAYPDNVQHIKSYIEMELHHGAMIGLLINSLSFY